jgi:5,10-methylenetetrahydrofolate reductase
MVASKVKSLLNQDVVFTIATRDKNHMALQSELLGAQLLGLENVIVVRGDPAKHENGTVANRTGGLPTTQVISGISNMNKGSDYRGIALDVPSDFCIGATIDLGRRFSSECNLVLRKIESGAHFFITQPVFDVTKALKLWENIESKVITRNHTPIFFGLQILEPDSISFSKVPTSLLDQLQKGKSHLELAVELYETFRKAGLNNVYLVPPIKKGGTRNYQAAIEVLAKLKSA